MSSTEFTQSDRTIVKLTEYSLLNCAQVFVVPNGILTDTVDVG